MGHLEVHTFKDSGETITSVNGGWIGVCEVCGDEKYESSGYALFHANGEWRGGAAWGQDGEVCRHGCKNWHGGTATVHPLPFKRQEAFVAAYVLGGWPAVEAMIPKWQQDILIKMRKK